METMTTQQRQGMTIIPISDALKQCSGIGGTGGGAAPLPGHMTLYCPGANDAPSKASFDDHARPTAHDVLDICFRN